MPLPTGPPSPWLLGLSGPPCPLPPRWSPVPSSHSAPWTSLPSRHCLWWGWGALALGIAHGFSQGRTWLLRLQEGQVELQASLNLLGDFRCLSLGFTLLLGGEIPEMDRKVCSQGTCPSPEEAGPWGPDWESPERA